MSQSISSHFELEWISQISGTGRDEGKSIMVDIFGNVYSTGYFQGTVDMDPSLGTYNLVSLGYSDIYVSKLNAQGNFVWAKQFGGIWDDKGMSLDIDSLGNILITGNFEKTVDFDPGPNTFNLTSVNTDIFVLKLDFSGNLVWAKQIGGNSTNVGYSITADNSGDIYVTGSFRGASDFNPGIDTLYLSSDALNSDAIFVLKLNSNGDFEWAESFGDGGTDFGKSIANDSQGNVYITGSFTGSIDFDPGPNSYFLTNNPTAATFISKLNSNGGFIWAKELGSTAGFNGSNSIKLDEAGAIYLGGVFNGTIDFDPSINIYELTSFGNIDAHITKLDNNGDFLWVKQIGGTDNDYLFQIALDKNGFIYSTGYFYSSADFDPSTGYFIFNTPNLSPDMFISKIDSSGDFVWAKQISGPNTEVGNSITIDILGNIYSTGYFLDNVNFGTDLNPIYINSTTDWDIFVTKYNQQNVIGNIFLDLNTNCIREPNEMGLANRRLTLQPNNIIVETNNSGFWGINHLTNGNYTITIDTVGFWLPTCPTTQNFTVANSDSLTFAPIFGFISTQPCAVPEVTIHMPFMRPCFTGQAIYVQACNTNLATGILANGYVELELDSFITPTSSSIPFTSLGNNTYSFDVGTLNPGQCVNFWINTTVSCSAILGQTLCMQANLYPADSCVFDSIPTPLIGGVEPCTLPWDHSSLSVDGWSQNDSIYFTVTNNGVFGNGDMQCYAPVRIYIDGVLTTIDSLLLVGGQTQTFVFASDGRTWRLEADQHPLHPGNSHPNATVELCGNPANWTPNLVNILPPNDADPVVDIYCGEVRASYDPNDKTGYPLGVGNNHFVAPNGKIDYVIRFQNTGTDTAFTVVVRDTLDVDLDIFSVQSGVSSHNYTFKMFGPRVLEWTFNYIMLPDSTSDLSGSNGFITFSVLQNPDLADGTVINNSASIYFDYNAPIFTNTTSHIINRSINHLVGVKETKNINNNSLFIYPNPTKNQLNIVLSTFQNLKIEIYAVDGKLIEQKSISKNTSINVSNYKTGLYFINATNNKGEVFRNKFVKE